MTFLRPGMFWAMLVVTTHCCGGQTLSTAVTNRLGTNLIGVPPVPSPSPTRCPVDFFRELLAKKPAERAETLSDRTLESRKRILAKVREYESMKPDQRELRLRLTELHWYMLPLMSLAPTNRPPNLDYIPEPSRKLVQDRLQEWDKLAASAQNALLTNQATIQHFFETKDLTGEQKRSIEASLTPQRKEMLCRGIEELQKLPPDDRQKMLDRFNQFFELTPTEKEKALTLLSEPERKQMEKTLQSLQSLPPDQRSQCIRSFDKFASMSLAERQLFLKNAERWKLMKPEERQRWRNLVDQMPLMPPTINTPPPIPPDTLPKRKSNPAVATNSY